MRSPIETKVAAAGLTGLAATIVLQLLASYVPGFHAPTAATVAAILTVLSSLAGYLAPHTARPADTAPVVTLTTGTSPPGTQLVTPTAIWTADRPVGRDDPVIAAFGIGKQPSSDPPPGTSQP